MNDNSDYGATTQQQRYLGYLLALAREHGRFIPYLPVEGLGRTVTSDWITYVFDQLPEDVQEEVRKARASPNGDTAVRTPTGATVCWPTRAWSSFRWLLSLGIRVPLNRKNAAILQHAFPVRSDSRAGTIILLGDQLVRLTERGSQWYAQGVPQDPGIARSPDHEHAITPLSEDDDAVLQCRACGSEW